MDATIQAEFSLEKSQVEFLERYKALGFKDRSEIVRLALDKFQQQLEQQELTRSIQPSRVPGIDKGRFTVPDDFDEPLPEDILNAFLGK